MSHSILFLALFLPAIAQSSASWPEADRLFHSDPRWLGADGAFSIDLGGGRVLWTFGDSFVARKKGDSRASAAFVRNTIAIQTGYDPSHATMKFYWRTTTGRPTEIFPSEGKIWMWPGHGVRVGSRLLLFCSRIAPEHKKNSLGFQSAGWTAYASETSDQEPNAWNLQKVAEDHGRVTLGSATLHEGEFVYIFGASEPEHDVYLARWSAKDIERGRFGALEWWSGRGWQTDESGRQPVMRGVGTEASVQRDPRGVAIDLDKAKASGFGATNIVMRRASHLEGPWSTPQRIYRPPESDAPDAFVYAGKSHPELRGADMVVTYAANGNSQRLAADMNIYFPRFVKIGLPHTAAMK